MAHWSDYLVRGFPNGKTSEITVSVNPDQTREGVLVVLSRLAGLVDALGPLGERDGADPLSRESAEDLYYLLDHLHRVRLCLQAQEERVLSVAHERGVSLRTLATALELSSPEAVRYRLQKIQAAARRGLSAAGLDKRDEDDLSTL